MVPRREKKVEKCAKRWHSMVKFCQVPQATQFVHRFPWTLTWDIVHSDVHLWSKFSCSEASTLCVLVFPVIDLATCLQTSYSPGSLYGSAWILLSTSQVAHAHCITSVCTALVWTQPFLVHFHPSVDTVKQRTLCSTCWIQWFKCTYLINLSTSKRQ